MAKSLALAHAMCTAFRGFNEELFQNGFTKADFRVDGVG